MSTDIIDDNAIRRLLSVIGGDREDFLELMEEFEESTPLLVDKMKQAATEANIDSLRISAHSLKSNARDFGAVQLASLCEALELACKNQDVPAPVDKVAEIEQALEAAREALRGMTLPDV
ncbi:MAG: Hpt domain-containing protein [Alphaproteobacteria bacterium]|nr:Hpt domain-containing protein [Alphaproteobacteria bacterium]